MSAIPTQKEYEEREIRMYFKKLEEVEKSPKQDRIEGFKELFDNARLNPVIISERIGWILDGSYGFGPYKIAERIVKETKNPNYHLFHILAHYEYLTSDYYASKVYRSLTQDQKDKLNELVTKEIEDYKADQEN